MSAGGDGRPTIALVFPALPPALDGIGDHTALLAAALAPHARVRILTAQEAPTPIPGVAIERAFGMERRSDIGGLVRAVEREPPDWLVVQFNQFSYGRWGLNPYLPRALRALRRRCPDVRVAWFAHEDFVPPSSWRFRVMRTWQRAQFRALGRAADLVLFTIAPWAERYRPWFPGARVSHLPVSSNVPDVGVPRAEARGRLGIAEGTFVAGVFGTVGGARPIGAVRRAVEALEACTADLLLLYVGPNGAVVRAALPGLPLHDAGPLPAAAVSAHLAAMDLHVTPFLDGVSTRRGSFMAGLQHGVPSVTTVGGHTDGVLRDAAGRAFVAVSEGDAGAFAARAVGLAADPAARCRMSAAARHLYATEFALDRAASRLLDLLALAERHPHPRPR